MNRMYSDACCTRAGWQEAEIEGDYESLHISHDPEADLDGVFWAFCHDTQEMIRINGWLTQAYYPINS